VAAERRAHAFDAPGRWSRAADAAALRAPRAERDAARERRRSCADRPASSAFRARIAELHGSTAMIAVAALGNDAIAYQVELPFIEETAGDADGVDR
jgi:hypothetical protein